MIDEQIEQILQKTGHKVHWHTSTLPFIAWSIVILCAGLVLWGGHTVPAAIVAVVLAVPAMLSTIESIDAWRSFKREPALTLWRKLADNPQLFSFRSSQLSKLKASLDSIYINDSRGEVLPIAQATRLLFIYNLQHQRRATIAERISQMQTVRKQLLEKVARLEDLGDPSPSLADGIDEMQIEIEALERLDYEIFVSCHRLEAIVLSVQKAIQVKQIHREIADLKSRVSSSKGSAQSLVAPEITDIERQISREIETFLQLERETDQRLRAP